MATARRALALLYDMFTPSVLRQLELVLSLAATALAAAGTVQFKSEPWFGFMTFVAAVGLALSLLWLWTYAYGPKYLPDGAFIASRLPALEMVMSTMWTVLWFTAAVGVIAYSIALDSESNTAVGKAAGAMGFFAMIAAGSCSVSAFRRFSSAPTSLYARVTEAPTHASVQTTADSDERRENAAAAAQRRSQQEASRGVPTRANYNSV